MEYLDDYFYVYIRLIENKPPICEARFIDVTEAHRWAKRSFDQYWITTLKEQVMENTATIDIRQTSTGYFVIIGDDVYEMNDNPQPNGVNMYFSDVSEVDFSDCPLLGTLSYGLLRNILTRAS